MTRRRFTVVLWLAVFGACLLLAAPAAADRPIVETLGGSFTNPCTGHEVTYDVEAILEGSDVAFGLQGIGTGTDLVTGETYRVILTLSGMTAPDETGSFTGHAVLVFVGGQQTFTVVSVANLNLHDGEPVFVGFESFVCAGSGPT
jgi:hypothetical protein